jgi:uncharacterized membrane protein YfcA
LFIAALIRSALGFGEALVAVPLLAFCIPLKVAAPLAVLASIAIYGAMQRWPAQHFRAALQAYFLPASIIGMAGYWRADLGLPR